AIAWSSAGGSRVLTGVLRTAFNSQGGIAVLGWPTSDASCAGSVCSQSFQSATVYDVSGSAFVVDARLAPAYSASGGPTGTLGVATTGLISIAASGGGLAQIFTGGAILSSPTGGVRVLTAAMRTAFNARGGIAVMGWPISDMTCSAGTCTQSFRNGAVSIPQ
ncbi:MAG TPA: hypothetical protein VK139_06090, partial [Microbacteriaceae bacterium]|nr:hypothetical protein [Microbacteriaceae bacterium]